MAFAHFLLAVPLDVSISSKKTSFVRHSSPPPTDLTETSAGVSLSFPYSRIKVHNKVSSLFSRRGFWTIASKTRENLQHCEASLTADAFTQIKHVLLPVTDRNPYLTEGTRQAAAATAALAKKYGAEITVVVIDENQKESLPEHDTHLSSIRWHLSEGGFQEFRLIERLGSGSQPTAIIGDE